MSTIPSTEAAAHSDTADIQKLTIGGGCFWCTEAVFETEPGVLSVVSGYAGGSSRNPTYEEVCSETTGHAEVIQIAFDPGKVSVETLLDLFWDAHDPTTMNRQGADRGTQYRSIILYENEEQREAAEKSKVMAQTKFDDRIVTEIVSLGRFYKAERYHQDYFSRNGQAPYCRAVIAPKLKKLGRDE